MLASLFGAGISANLAANLAALGRDMIREQLGRHRRLAEGSRLICKASRNYLELWNQP